MFRRDAMFSTFCFLHDRGGTVLPRGEQTGACVTVLQGRARAIRREDYVQADHPAGRLRSLVAVRGFVSFLFSSFILLQQGTAASWPAKRGCVTVLQERGRTGGKTCIALLESTRCPSGPSCWRATESGSRERLCSALLFFIRFKENYIGHSFPCVPSAV